MISSERSQRRRERHKKKQELLRAKLKLTEHRKQAEFLWSPRRFNVVPAGRRSGKTEIGKRRLIRKALECPHDEGHFVAAAPTYTQAKKIFWKDLKRYTEQFWIGTKKDSVSETEMTITLRNAAVIRVMGLHEPERIEGEPVDHILIDEIANVKPQAWQEHISPALDTIGRPGSADFTGVPEGRNHYYELYETARKDTSGDWFATTWMSSEILPPEYIAAAKRRLDALVYKQEYEASFISFAGLAYYGYQESTHVVPELQYVPHDDLILCFDFNTAPGICIVAQERNGVTDCIGEVYIPQHSNTPMVCRALLEDWGSHAGRVLMYGDATGGAKKTSSVAGSDWELIEQELSPVFGDRLLNKVPSSNPSERARVNAMNSHLMNTAGEWHLRMDPHKVPNLIRDMENTSVIEGTGEINKRDKKWSHMTDALGYYVAEEHGLDSGSSVSVIDAF